MKKKPIAIAIIHGIGHDRNFIDKKKTRELIEKYFKQKIKPYTDDPSSQIFTEFVNWENVFQPREDKLFEKAVLQKGLDYSKLRQLVISYMADAIAYQPVEGGRDNYRRVHQAFGETLKNLSQWAGPDVPLCVISHSLGSVIASNYFYDLQAKRETGKDTALEKGETLSLFYTLGTTLPLWSLRYENGLNNPIVVPAPEMKVKHPNLKGEWVNFYDKDDILGYPLKIISDEYEQAVHEDIEVNVGNILTSWNPASHTQYLGDTDVAERIAAGLFQVWCHMNNIEIKEKLEAVKK
ncbi:chemotaxis protein [Bacillus sp. 165]|uniref:chemotaxis protein n=1 Tax=Bacillus sp. 165 TaxID=1529117 RepID=UPI001ADCC80E|nr:chemotaxis protein [Bacillus sp. 165]MBO9129116.1 chemotaxis protein [Bacillus sp. 165]